jgi:sensor domain CHASE-containing protein
MPWTRPSTFLRKFGLPMIAVVSAFLAIGLSMLIWMTYAQDDLQMEQERNLANAALHSRIEFLTRNLGDYGIWNDAVENMVRRPQHPVGQHQSGTLFVCHPRL